MINLIYPMGLLVLFTLMLLFVIGIGRVLAIKSRQVSIKTFVLMEGKTKLSTRLQQLDRNFSNLLEVPVLFYLWCLIVIFQTEQDAGLMALAWAYVTLRIIHSIIHITYNNVNHRFIVFVISCLLLFYMWVRLLLMV